MHPYVHKISTGTKISAATTNHVRIYTHKVTKTQHSYINHKNVIFLCNLRTRSGSPHDVNICLVIIMCRAYIDLAAIKILFAEISLQVLQLVSCGQATFFPFALR